MGRGRGRAARAGVLAGAVASVAGVVLGGLVLLGVAAPAAAHATLIGTVPAVDAVVEGVPDEVELRFDEPVAASEDGIEVYGPDGDRVDRGQVDERAGGATLVVPVDDAGEGTYTVAWRVTSEDSHTITGSFVFHDGARTGAVDIDDGGSTANDVVGGVGRWLGLAGTMVAAGAAVVALLIAGGQDRGGTDEDVERASPVLRRLAIAGGVAGAVGAFVALLAVLAEGAGRAIHQALPLVVDVAPDTRTGQLLLARVGLGAAVAAAASSPRVWRRAPAVVLALATAAMVAASVAGHAWTAPDRWVAVASDLVHFGAVAVWIGGLVGLFAVLPLLGGTNRGRLARRFSGLALAVAALVAVSGTVSGWQQVRTLDGLTSTTYGQLLLVKVVGFAMLVVLGWLNRTRLVPMAERDVDPLWRSVRVELLVATVVLAVTAALIQQPPARTSASEGPFDTTVTVESGEVLSATVVPAEVGTNDLHLYFRTATGAPLPVDAVAVTTGTDGVPARSLQVTPITVDHVTVTGASFPSPGTWTVETTAVVAGQPLVFTFEVPIA